MREKLPIWTPHSFILTTMSLSTAKPPLKLLALGRYIIFALSTWPLANQYLLDRRKNPPCEENEELVELCPLPPAIVTQTTKNLLTEAQRIAYVGLVSLASREMVQCLKVGKRKELNALITDMELWALKIMGHLFYHMELKTQGLCVFDL